MFTRPSRLLEDHIKDLRPAVADERSDEYKEVQAIIREELAAFVPQMLEMPQYYAQENLPRSVYHFDTYAEFMAQPYRGPIGEEWFGPDEAALEVGPQFSWRPFLVGTLIISDLRLITLREQVIAHLDRPVVGTTVYLFRNGFDGIATTAVFSYGLAVGTIPEGATVLAPAYGEVTLADVVGNHWRYEYDKETDTFRGCSDRQAERNWLKGKLRYQIGKRVGDDGARIADYGKLIKVLLAAVFDKLTPETQAVVADLVDASPDLNSLARVVEREKAISEVIAAVGYPNVSQD